MLERIQMKRTKGWRKPAGAVYVGRPTKWGNPYLVKDGDHQEAVEAFRAYMASEWAPDITSLRGKDLACWCKPGEPCHADVLLELANRPTRPSDEDAVTGPPDDYTTELKAAAFKLFT